VLTPCCSPHSGARFAELDIFEGDELYGEHVDPDVYFGVVNTPPGPFLPDGLPDMSYEANQLFYTDKGIDPDHTLWGKRWVTVPPRSFFHFYYLFILLFCPCRAQTSPCALLKAAYHPNAYHPNASQPPKLRLLC
jgi:hypothetical protein